MKKVILGALLVASFAVSSSAMAAPKTSFSGSGTFKVGTQIAAGIYISANTVKQSCYWERLSDFSGDFEAILANDFAKGQVIVQILPEDKGFKSSGCAKFYKIGTLKTLKSIPAEGTYQVGKQILPGTYQSKSTSGSCYWARLGDFQGGLDSILTNDYSKGQQIVEIDAGDKGFETSGCGGWTKIG